MIHVAFLFFVGAQLWTLNTSYSSTVNVRDPVKKYLSAQLAGSSYVLPMALLDEGLSFAFELMKRSEPLPNDGPYLELWLTALLVMSLLMGIFTGPIPA
jgi:hypothetical protein